MKYSTPIIAMALASFFAQGDMMAQTGNDVPTIYGFMQSNDEWSEGSRPEGLYGFYSFRADGSVPFSAVSSVGPDNVWASQGGVYGDHRYYCYSVSGNWMKYTLIYRVLDTNSWTTVSSNAFTYLNSDKTGEESQKAYLVPTDLAYDAVNDIVYAAARRYQSQDDSYLCTVNVTTGELTRVVTIPPMVALTAAADGSLSGIGIDGNMYSISTDSGATLVGHTGMWPSDSLVQSATTDFRTGDIYWSCYAFSSQSDRSYNTNVVLGMMRVNPETAESSLMFSYPHNEYFTSVSIFNPHPDSPVDITDLSFKPAGFESTDAVVSFTVPAVNATGAALTGDLTVSCYIDNELRLTKIAAPGSSFSETISGVSEGMRKCSVEVSDGEHSGNPAVANAYFGYDRPAAVSGVILSADETRTVATLSWEAPVTGANGSEYDPSKIRYRVVRYPDGAVIKRSYSETSLTDNIPYEYARTYYEVSPYHEDHVSDTGKSSRSNAVMMGSDISLPYSQSFNDEASFGTFSTIDANGDGSDDWESPCWKFDPAYYCAFYYGMKVTADDWLITPPLKFSPDRLYRLSYKYYAYYGYGSHFKVAVGSDAEVEKMDMIIQDVETVSSFSDYPGIEQSVIFSVREGDRMIGFHHMSETIEHLSIDDILIEDVGDARVPDRVTGLNGTRIGDYSLELSFTMPLVTAGGAALPDEVVKANIYRSLSLTPDATLEGKPGEAMTWTDTEALKDVNEYRIVVTNGYGDGLETGISIDLSEGLPQAVTDANAVYINDRQVEITWKTPADETDSEGHPIDTANIRYLVYKPVMGEFGYMDKLIGRDVDGCRFVDDDPMAGLPEGQQSIYYTVVPVNGTGTGAAAMTGSILVGESYPLPFAETWVNQTQSTSPWTTYLNDCAYWSLVHRGYTPSCDGQDGYGLLKCEPDYGYSYGVASFKSPCVDFTTKSGPCLSFYMYRSPEYDDVAGLSFAIDTNGDGSLSYTSPKYPARSDTEGWELMTFDLSEFSAETRVSVILTGTVSSGKCVYVDNLQIDGGEVTGEVRPVHIVGDSEVVENSVCRYTGTLVNTTGTAVSDVKVSLKADGTEVGTATVPAIGSGETASVDLEFTPGSSHIGTTILSLSIVSPGYTDKSVTKEVLVEKLVTPVVTDLTAEVGESCVTLDWSLPTATDEPRTVNDSFEAYDDFTIRDFGAWSVYDGDGNPSLTFGDGQGGIIGWPNAGEPQAFIVFNPSALAVEAPFAPFSGSRFIVSWSSYLGNNDWIISPELSGGSQLISFYAKSAMEAGEQFHVLVSKTDNDPESFISLTGSTPVSAPEEWTLFHYALPEGSKYFAIRYVSERQTGLMVDDVMFSGYHSVDAPDGYNIYRNGILLNEEPLAVRTYADSDIEDSGSYSYVVRPVYNGVEAADSNVALVSLNGVGSVGSDGMVSIFREDGAIRVIGADGMRIEVCNVNGIRVADVCGTSDTLIPVATGLYIVKAGTATAKLIVK